jgi:multiple sugar transport system permease protein
MVYPFVLMLATSVTSGVDVNNFQAIPSYIYDNGMLFSKYAEDKYLGDFQIINDNYQSDFAKLEEVAPPKLNPNDPKVKALVRDWQEFLKSLSLDYKQVGFTGYLGSPSRTLNLYRKWLVKRFDNDIAKCNRAYLEENESFQQVMAPFERPSKRDWQPDNSAKMRDWMAFKSQLPAEFHIPSGCDSIYATFLKEDRYDGDISNLNKAYGTNYKNFYQVHLASSIPSQPAERGDWEEFVRNMLPFRYMKISDSALAPYRSFLKGRYSTIEHLNKRYEKHYASFDQVKIPTSLPAEGAELLDYTDFVRKIVPITAVKAVNIENLYREHLLTEYGSLNRVNDTYNLHAASVLDISTPVYASDWVHVNQHAKALRMDFLTRNYVMVIDYIVLHGRAVFVTVIFILAVILTHLIVNPLCAYSLSRYNLRYSYKVLLFLLATMAFPAEVTMIPNFLMLKNFHMLNTFWALILPGMASGFSIFLLKGFFDSLPRELYEAGLIDGASEARMFWKITIPLSKPIFAVIALQSFTSAYGAFMFALLVCQNPKMWTIMVWLYELQITAPKYVTMAALTVAALPTLLVFIFAQNIIMRGIILPSYK